MAIRILSAKSCRLSLPIVALAGVSVCASAQTDAPVAKPDERAAKQMELRGVEDTLKASEEQRRQIEADVEAIRVDRARLNAALIETTAKVQENESRRAAANARLGELNAKADELNFSLQSRRDQIADLLAVLQRMGRNPPPAFLLRPDDMVDAIRASILLGSMIPDLNDETKALAADLQKLASLRASISKERDELTQSAAELALDKTRLTDLINARQQSLAVAEMALNAERARATELAGQAGGLKDLIARMESEIGAAKAGAAAALAADQAAAAEVASRAAATRGADPARLRPAIAFADAKGQVPLPVAGAVLKTFGEPDSYGGAEKGVSIATPPAATVSSPIDGWVVYAGPYRTYGQLLILNAGGGYYMVLAGMDRINVSVGQFVLAGEPVAAMGDGSARTAAAAAIGAMRPVLYIELRKNETAIDPGPWWAKSNIEKARG
jgi:septal ring factor EnvC (AmiA/AmiB activator)